MNSKHVFAAASSVTLLFAVALAAGTPAQAAPSSEHAQRLHFIADYVDGSQQDAAPSGDSIGDTAVDLFHLVTDSGRDAGSASSICTLLRAGTSPLAQCSGTLALTGGTVVLGGTTTGTPITTYAVLGGTGQFSGTQGTAAFEPSGPSVAVSVSFTH